VLSNPKYSNLFNYIGVFVSERYKIIEDGSIDHEENGHTIYPEEVQRIRGEQSDLIMVLLNLAYIPDKVIEKMEDFNAGWSLKFKELMRRHFKNDKYQMWNERQMTIQAEVDAQHPNKNELERK